MPMRIVEVALELVEVSGASENQEQCLLEKENLNEE